MKFYGYFFIIFFSLYQPLYAKNPEYTGNCITREYLESIEICLDKELNVYDQELNKLYNNLMKFPNNDLKKVEKLWIKFKQADCSYMAKEVNEGKEYQFIEKICLINKTKTRIADLKRSYFSSGWLRK